MNFIFFGTPDVARDTLNYLKERGLTPAAVVTNPDAPQGRGQVMSPSPVKEWALENNIPVHTPSTLDSELIKEITSYNSGFAIVVAYGKILPENLIQSFPKGVLNVHYSLLPKYRGAAPVEAALLNNDEVTGVTVQKMVRELDAGDVVAVKEEKILPEDTTVTLRTRLITIGADLLADSLPGYLAGEIVPMPQDYTKATHAGKIKKEEGLLDLSAPDKANWSKYRAYAAGPGTYFFTPEGLRVKVVSAHLSEDGDFVIDRVVPAGKKEMDYKKITA